jgi:hypothetical protein
LKNFIKSWRPSSKNRRPGYPSYRVKTDTDFKDCNALTANRPPSQGYLFSGVPDDPKRAEGRDLFKIYARPIGC